MNNQSCGNCIYYGGVESGGACRRSPKLPYSNAIFKNNEIEEYITKHGFPLMNSDEWCGEWKLKYEES